MPYQRCLCICLPGMVTTGSATACSGYIWDIGSWCAGALGATAAHGPGNADEALVLIHPRGRSKNFPALLQDPKRCLCGRVARVIVCCACRHAISAAERPRGIVPGTAGQLHAKQHWLSCPSGPVWGFPAVQWPCGAVPAQQPALWGVSAPQAPSIRFCHHCSLQLAFM